MKSIFVVLCVCVAACSGLRPLLIVGGLGGGRLEWRARPGDDSSPWIPVWVDQVFFLNRTLERTELVYDAVSDSFSNKRGEARAIGFGNVSGIEYLMDLPPGKPLVIADYFHKLIKFFVDRGYVRGHDIAAASFDWRFAYEYLLDTWAPEMDKLVERMYHENGELPVVILAHCYGGNVLTRYLRSRPAEWKSKYVAAYVPVAVPFLGALKALEMVMSGYDMDVEIFGVPVLNPKTLRSWSRTVSSVTGAIPPADLRGADQPLIHTPGRDYYWKDLSALFATTPGMEVVSQVYARLDTTPIKAPGTKVNCIVFTGIQTGVMLNYTHSEDPFEHPASKHTVTEEGDRTVTKRSASHCKTWDGVDGTSVEVKEFQGDHFELIKNKEFIQAVWDIVQQ